MTALAAADIALRDLIVTYARVPAVHHVSGVFRAGTLTAVAGPNGAGKSTLIKAVAGLIAPSGGTIERGGMRPRDFAYLPQLPEIDRSFPISVAETVAMGAWSRIGIFGGVGDKVRHAVAEALACVGLGGYARAPIAALSAGQWQRVLFARAIVQDAPVLLLDEPFAGVDDETAHHLMTLIRQWHQEKRTVIAVLHDAAFIRANFPETLLIARELVACGATGDVLNDANLERARALTARWARSDDAHHAHEHA